MSKTKSILIRVPLDTWKYLRKATVEEGTSMNKIFSDYAQKFKEKRENKEKRVAQKC